MTKDSVRSLQQMGLSKKGQQAVQKGRVAALTDKVADKHPDRHAGKHAETSLSQPLLPPSV